MEKDIHKKRNDDALNYIHRMIDKIVNEDAKYDLLAVLCTLTVFLEPDKALGDNHDNWKRTYLSSY